jgi:hypothetical protein
MVTELNSIEDGHDKAFPVSEAADCCGAADGAAVLCRGVRVRNPA